VGEDTPPAGFADGKVDDPSQEGTGATGKTDGFGHALDLFIDLDVWRGYSPMGAGCSPRKTRTARILFITSRAATL
jgi:hypothetical protein